MAMRSVGLTRLTSPSESELDVLRRTPGTLERNLAHLDRKFGKDADYRRKRETIKYRLQAETVRAAERGGNLVPRTRAEDLARKVLGRPSRAEVDRLKRKRVGDIDRYLSAVEAARARDREVSRAVDDKYRRLARELAPLRRSLGLPARSFPGPMLAQAWAGDFSVKPKVRFTKAETAAPTSRVKDVAAEESRRMRQIEAQLNAREFVPPPVLAWYADRRGEQEAKRASRSAPKPPRTIEEIDRREKQVGEAMLPLWDAMENGRPISAYQRSRFWRLWKEATDLGQRRKALERARPSQPDRRDFVRKAIDYAPKLVKAANEDADRTMADYNRGFEVIAKPFRETYPTGLVPKKLYELLEQGKFSGDRFNDRLTLEILKNLDPTQIPQMAAELTRPDWRERIKETATLGLSNPELRKKLAQADPDAWATLSAGVLMMAAGKGLNRAGITLKSSMGGPAYGPPKRPLPGSQPAAPKITGRYFSAEDAAAVADELVKDGVLGEREALAAVNEVARILRKRGRFLSQDLVRGTTRLLVNERNWQNRRNGASPRQAGPKGLSERSKAPQGPPAVGGRSKSIASGGPSSSQEASIQAKAGPRERLLSTGGREETARAPELPERWQESHGRRDQGSRPGQEPVQVSPNVALRTAKVAFSGRDYASSDTAPALPTSRTSLDDGASSTLPARRPPSTPDGPGNRRPGRWVGSDESTGARRKSGPAIVVRPDGTIGWGDSSSRSRPSRTTDGGGAPEVRGPALPGWGGSRPTSPSSIKTSNGWTYRVHPDGTTTRAVPSEPGRRPSPLDGTRSEVTFFADPAAARKLASLLRSPSGGRKVLVSLPKGRIGLRFAEGPHKGKLVKGSVVPAAQFPRVGLAPVEAFGSWNAVRIGSPVVRVGVSLVNHQIPVLLKAQDSSSANVDEGNLKADSEHGVLPDGGSPVEQRHYELPKAGEETPSVLASIPANAANGFKPANRYPHVLPHDVPISQWSTPPGDIGRRVLHGCHLVDHYIEAFAPKHKILICKIYENVRVNGNKTRKPMDGLYIPRKQLVLVHPKTRYPILTTVHENGHVIDIHGLRPLLKNYPAFKALYNEVFRVIEASPTYIVLSGLQTAARDPDLIKHLEYLTRREELWARAFAQWIAVRSKDQDLGEEFRTCRRETASTFPTQWTDQEFRLIDKAIENVLRAAGLLKISAR